MLRSLITVVGERSRLVMKLSAYKRVPFLSLSISLFPFPLSLSLRLLKLFYVQIHFHEIPKRDNNPNLYNNREKYPNL